MNRNAIRIGFFLGVAGWLVPAGLQDVLALPQEQDAQAGMAQATDQEDLAVVRALISGSIVDERGDAVVDAWLTIVAAEDPSAKVPVALDDAGHFGIVELPGDAAEGLWTIGEVGAYGHLPITLSVQPLDSDGRALGEAETLDYLPGVPMPRFEIPAGGTVRIRLVMGEKREVAARWAAARRKAHESAPKRPQAGQGGIGGEASALWTAGNAKFGARDFAGALADYDAALERAPGEPSLLSAKARALYYLGKNEEARQAAEEALRAGSDDLQLLLALADRFNKAGDARNARAILELLEEKAPDSAEIQVQRARLAKQAGDAAAAVAAYRRATRLSPRNPKLWAEMATFCRENGDTTCAREAYLELVGVDPEFDKTAYYFLGTLSEGQQAIEYFEQSVRYFPEAYIKLCVAYREAGQKDKAIAACSSYLEAKPDGPQAEEVKAVLHALQQ